MENMVAELTDSTHHTSLMTSVRQFINTDSFVDVQFICQGGQKVFAHKLILISVSRLLKKILLENLNSNEMITIHLPDVSSKLLRIVVKFLYIGSMRLNNDEMDQFKLVLGLLDIDLFMPDLETASTSSSELPNSHSTLQNNASQSAVQSPTQPLTQTPISRSTYPQVLPTQFVSVPEGQPHMTSLPIGNNIQQYISVKANELTASHNEGEVLIPLSVVQRTVPVLSGQDIVATSSQFPISTNNTIIQPTLVSTNMAQLSTPQNVPTQQLPVQQLVAQHYNSEQIPVQQNQPQTSQVQYTPTQESSKSIKSFSQTTPETSGTSILQKSGVKRKLSNFLQSKPTDVIDLSEDDGDDAECQLQPKIISVQSLRTSNRNGARPFVGSQPRSKRRSNNNNNDINTKEIIDLDQ